MQIRRTWLSKFLQFPVTSPMGIQPWHFWRNIKLCLSFWQSCGKVSEAGLGPWLTGGPGSLPENHCSWCMRGDVAPLMCKTMHMLMKGATLRTKSNLSEQGKITGANSVNTAKWQQGYRYLTRSMILLQYFSCASRAWIQMKRLTWVRDFVNSNFDPFALGSHVNHHSLHIACFLTRLCGLIAEYKQVGICGDPAAKRKKIQYFFSPLLNSYNIQQLFFFQVLSFTPPQGSWRSLFPDVLHCLQNFYLTHIFLAIKRNSTPEEKIWLCIDLHQTTVAYLARVSLWFCTLGSLQGTAVFKS